MKSPPFAYARAGSLAEVFDLLETHGEDARILAGGQSLMPTLNMRLSDPQILIDINHVADLGGIAAAGDGLKIGALTRHVEVERSDLIAQKAPLIAAAMDHIAHPAIRNRGTLGGSLALGDPAAEMPACMIALEAGFELSSKSGVREVPAAAFYHGLYETALEPGEVLTAINVPGPKPDQKHAFHEIVRRHGDFAMTGVAASAQVSGGKISGARFVYFAVTDRPVLAASAGAAIDGGDLGGGIDATIEAFGAALAQDLDPDADLHASAAMKSHLAKVIAGRALRDLAA